MTKINKSIANLLHQSEDFVLATILSKFGSSPGTAGRKMVVRRDGSILGTIGGGLVEARVQQLATRVMDTGRPLVEQFNLTGTEVASMDMICGGKIEVLIEYIDANDTVLKEIYNLAVSDNVKGKAVLVTQFYDGAQGININRHYLVKEDADADADLLPSEVVTLILENNLVKSPQVLELDSGKYLLELLAGRCTLFLVGAGHISQQLCPLANRVDFKTVVLDDRPEFANQARFPSANNIKVISSFTESFADLEIDGNSFIVIVTRGHAHDKTVLRQALSTSAGYIGMIGSKSKRNAIYQALLREGITQADLGRVYSPIGLAIGADTPAEIAISILAEIIKVRAEMHP